NSGTASRAPTAFAAVVAAFLAVALQRRPRGSGRRLFGFFFLALASHGVADALTNGGLGIAFFAPFSNARYFFPFRPVAVSPIGLERFFSSRGGAVLRSEAIWLVLPSLGVFAAATIARGIERERRTGGTRKSGGL
ncbi:MAG TPA: metal-dependent hydrolase, partial [Elusimicrobiota bacterium]|nr:metal-dependent hydrolase [Elusimicrobiota bacterium]